MRPIGGYWKKPYDSIQSTFSGCCYQSLTIRRPPLIKQIKRDRIRVFRIVKIESLFKSLTRVNKMNRDSVIRRYTLPDVLATAIVCINPRPKCAHLNCSRFRANGAKQVLG